MKKVIYKYPLSGKPDQIIEVPEDHKILCVQLQDGIPTLWIEVIPGNDLQKVRIVTIGTGHTFEMGLLQYIGTVQTGFLVWHVYEDKEVIY